jgi:PhnB protein
VNAYLNFNGQCEEAFRFYERCFGGKIDAMMTHAGSPMEGQVPAEWRNKILHARMTVDGQVLMASDVPPNRYEKPQGFAVSLGIEKMADAQRIFQALSEGGTVQMPLQKTFWAAGFGGVTDRFGIPWMINCETEG